MSGVQIFVKVSCIRMVGNEAAGQNTNTRAGRLNLNRSPLSTAQLKVWMIAGIAIATLLAGVSLQIFRDRQTVLDATANTTTQLSLTLEASVRGLVQSAELVADHVGTLTLSSLESNGDPTSAAVQQWVDILSEREFMSAIAFVRPDGVVPVATGRFSDGDISVIEEPIDLSNWPAFRVHKDGLGRTLFIAPPRRSAFFDRWIVSLTRPLRGEGGELLGVVYVDIALDVLLELFSEVLPAGNNSVALFKQDAKLLFSYPF